VVYAAPLATVEESTDCAVLSVPAALLPFLFLRGMGVTAPAGEPSHA
jgi:hypothetical protein